MCVSDRDPKFSSAFWKRLHALYGTRLSFSTAYHPESDSLTERSNRSVLEILRATVNSSKEEWDLLLPAVIFSLNNSVHSSTNQSPFFVVNGYNATLPLDIGTRTFTKEVESAYDLFKRRVQAIKDAKDTLYDTQLQMKSLLDEKRQHVDYNLGDLVLLSTKNRSVRNKVDNRWEGPYRIIRKPTPTTVTLDISGRRHPTFNVRLVKPYVSDAEDITTSAGDSVDDVEEEFELEDILKKRISKDGLVEYLVKWRDYPLLDATWEPVDHLIPGAKEAVDKFEGSLKKGRKTLARRARGRAPRKGGERCCGH